MIKEIKNKTQLDQYIDSVDINTLLKDKRIFKILEVLNNKGINVNFDVNRKNIKFCGYANRDNSITIYVYGALFDIISKYLKNGGFFGDISISNMTFDFKDDYDILVFPIIFTILHEYKHCHQYSEGLMCDVNTEYKNGYVSEEAIWLELEAEKFAYSNIYNVMMSNDYSFIV